MSSWLRLRPPGTLAKKDGNLIRGFKERMRGEKGREQRKTFSVGTSAYEGRRGRSTLARRRTDAPLPRSVVPTGDLPLCLEPGEETTG